MRLIAVTMALAVSWVQAQPLQPETAQELIFQEARTATFLAQHQLSERDVRELNMQDLVFERDGRVHAYVQQLHQNLPIEGAVMGLHFNADGDLTSSNSRAVSIPSRMPAYVAPEQWESAIPSVRSYEKESMGAFTVYQPGYLYWKACWWPTETGLASAVYIVCFDRLSQSWVTRWVTKEGLVHEGTWTQDCAWGGPAVVRRAGDNAQYKAFDFPIESPLYGSPSLLNSPADSLASPFGWHDVDGVSGAEYTITRGNNVYASEDANADDQPGYSPSSSTLDFQYSFDQSMVNPSQYQDFAITNLFVINNRLHDILWHYGFDEAAGNFQQKNYSGAGKGNDAVQADAQDGSGTNNANFSTPPDGSDPRMQMYVWDGGGGSGATLQVESNGNRYSVGMQANTWGKALSDQPVVGKLVWVEDGTSQSRQGCATLDNGPDLSGNIAAIMRGGCTFAQKVYKAQREGAIAAVIFDTSATDQVITMASDNTTQARNTTISAAFLKYSHANIIKALMNNGDVEIRLFDSSAYEPMTDSDLEMGVIAHEFGHGVSNRLTCGPSNSNGLNNNEQMGEGWSDFLCLALTHEPGDVGSDPRGIGNWLINEDRNGGGIRTYPYSTNMSVNPHTYQNIAKAANGVQTSVHYVGEVWCSMLWDMYWEFVDEYGFDSDLSFGTGGNNMAIQLVIDAMKLQPCGPGFVDGRDAILEADDARYGGKHADLIWKSFARRGLGYSAAQGNPNNTADGEEAFDLPAQTNAVESMVSEWVRVFPNPSQDWVRIEPREVHRLDAVQLFDAQGREISVVKRVHVGGALTLDMRELPAGLYTLSIQSGAKLSRTSLIHLSHD